jgi:hypothetical protein
MGGIYCMPLATGKSEATHCLVLLTVLGSVVVPDESHTSSYKCFKKRASNQTSEVFLKRQSVMKIVLDKSLCKR